MNVIYIKQKSSGLHCFLHHYTCTYSLKTGYNISILSWMVTMTYSMSSQRHPYLEIQLKNKNAHSLLSGADRTWAGLYVIFLWYAINYIFYLSTLEVVALHYNIMMMCLLTGLDDVFIRLNTDCSVRLDNDGKALKTLSRLIL